MTIAGLQRMTLLDFPGKVACTVFLAGCNLRCPFCHNRELVLPEERGSLAPLTREELLDFLRRRQGMLDGVCVTGGEPLLSNEVFGLLREIKALGYAVKLDTNGGFPARLRRAVEEGLADFVAMDIKNAPARYAETAGIAGLSLAPFQESIDYLMGGAVPFEFRTTVVRELHREEDLIALARWISGPEAWFLQSFQDGPGVLRSGLHPWTEHELRAALDRLRPFVPKVALRGV